MPINSHFKERNRPRSTSSNYKGVSYYMTDKNLFIYGSLKGVVELEPRAIFVRKDGYYYLENEKFGSLSHCITWCLKQSNFQDIVVKSIQPTHRE